MNFVQYDNNRPLPFKVTYKNEPFDVTDSTVLVTVKLPGRKEIISKNVNFVNAKSGDCEVILTSSDLYYPGKHYFQATVITPDGLEFSNETEKFNVLPKLEGKLLGMPEYDIPANLKGPKGDPGPQGPPGESVDTAIINEQLQVIEDKIKEVEESIGNGSGNGSGIQSFQKLSDLQTALPNGSVQPVWVIEENDWYYWSGTTPPTDTIAPIVTITPVAGTYATAKTIILTVNETADIFYTLDGSTPTTLSTKYNGPITIDSTKTIKYFAKDTAGNSSAVQSAAFTINIDTTAPVLTITTGGTFTGTKTVTMSVNEAADIFYTLDGSTPTTSSNKYTTPLSISSTTTLKAFAKDTVGNASAIQTVVYTLDATPPVDTTPPENVTGLAESNKTQTGLTLSWVASTSPDTASYDILNGSTVIGNVTGTTFNVTGLTANTIYTFTVKAKDTSNNVSSGTNISVTTLANTDTNSPGEININIPGGLYSSPQTIHLDTSNGSIYYTTDGTDPKTSASKQTYSTPIIISTINTVLKYYNITTNGVAGNVKTQLYSIGTIDVNDKTPATLTMPPSGDFYGTKEIKISTNEAANIYYTTDGTDPKTSATKIRYNGELYISNTTTMKAVAIDINNNPSAIQTTIYTLDNKLSEPHLKLNGTSDYLKTPIINFNSIEMDFYSNQSTGITQYYWDSRNPGTNSYYVSNNTSNVDAPALSSFETVFVNGVQVTSTPYVPKNKRAIVKWNTLKVGTGVDVNVFSNNANIEGIEGYIYSIKFYNDNILVCHYDMSKGNVLDQSGNNNHGILVGGIWKSGTEGI